MAAGFETVVLQVMHNDPGVGELRLAYNFVGDAGSTALGKALTTNSVLQKLSLANSQIEPKGAEELCKGVAHNRGLQVLTLYGNRLMDEGGTALGRMLLTNRTLTKLDLDDAGIGPRGCMELCKGLSKNRSLLELNMQENAFGDEGFTALGNALSINKTLQQVSIGGNRGVTDVGLTMLALGLRRRARADKPLNLTGIDIAPVAETLGMLPPPPGGWNTIKMLQAFHDGVGRGTCLSGVGVSASLQEAVSKPISWTSSTVSIATEALGAAPVTLVAGDTYSLLVSLYDDWGDMVTRPDLKAAACQVLSIYRYTQHRVSNCKSSGPSAATRVSYIDLCHVFSTADQR